MKRFSLFLLLIVVLAAAGCATAAKPVKHTRVEKVPAQKPGESAVFGRVSLIRKVDAVYLPDNEISGAIYLKQEGTDKLYKISCSRTGEFGVYLPGATYQVVQIEANDYDMRTEMSLTVPPDQKAVYTGSIILDGTPSGIAPGGKGTLFAYTVKDEQKAYEASIRKQVPDADVKFYKSLFTPAGGEMAGPYPRTVFNSKTIERDFKAGSDAIEEVAYGTFVALTYMINPLVLFTLPF